MPKTEIPFDDFLANVTPDNVDFVTEVHGYLLDNGCSFKIEAAKNGHVLSYLLPKTKKTLLNYVFRKSGMLVRIYADGVSGYADILETLPLDMIKAIEKAPPCKRLSDIAPCNSRCPMGYVFELNGTLYKKCRYNSFMFAVNDESHASIRQFIERELVGRTA
jgi:hypothetical protein